PAFEADRQAERLELPDPLLEGVLLQADPAREDLGEHRRLLGDQRENLLRPRGPLGTAVQLVQPLKDPGKFLFVGERLTQGDAGVRCDPGAGDAVDGSFAPAMQVVEQLITAGVPGPVCIRLRDVVLRQRGNVRDVDLSHGRQQRTSGPHRGPTPAPERQRNTPLADLLEDLGAEDHSGPTGTSPTLSWMKVGLRWMSIWTSGPSPMQRKLCTSPASMTRMSPAPASKVSPSTV